VDLWKIFIRLKQEQLNEAEQPITQKARLKQSQEGSNGPISYVPPQQWERNKAKDLSSEPGTQDALTAWQFSCQ